MCTVIVLHRMRADYPVVLATNRDEYLARPTSPPQRLLENPITVGGRDLVAGGTWLGVTAAGVFVCVTNQRMNEVPSVAKRSRGEVVLQALAQAEPEAITRYVEGLDAREYNPFNLMWGDAQGLWVGYARRDHRDLEIAPVPEGLHVLPNDRLDCGDFPKVQRAVELLAPAASGDFAALVAALKNTLSDRERPPLHAIPAPQAEAPLNRPLLRELAALNIKTPGYGTRSSTLIALAPGKVGHFLYADGAPDEAPFVDVTPLYAATGDGR